MDGSNCPECDHQINFSSYPERGERILCPQCRSELVVIREAPVELDWAFMEPFTNSEVAGGINGMGEY
jgi:hypothetical protein